MIKLAFYGKGGIGKSTTVSNLAAVWAEQGMRVLQIGCDPKADSTLLLRHGEELPCVVDLVRAGRPFELADVVREGFGGVLCAEAGGPLPGRGCAGRGIATALETLEDKGAIAELRPDVVLYDVLGDVVCGGFAMPMRGDYAKNVFIVTSGEKMSLYAAANIALALERFKNRGYARLTGLIQNSRNVPNETALVAELAGENHIPVAGIMPREELIARSEALGRTVVAAFPESDAAVRYAALAGKMLALSDEA